MDRQRWEYDVRRSAWSEVAEALTQAGFQGWEAWSLQEGKPGRVLIFLKRPAVRRVDLDVIVEKAG